MRDIRLPSRSRWELRSSGVITQHVVAVPYRSFGQPIGPILKGQESKRKSAIVLSSFIFVTNLFNHAVIFCCYCWFMQSSLGFVNRIIKKKYFVKFCKGWVGCGFKCRNYFCQLWKPPKISTIVLPTLSTIVLPTLSELANCQLTVHSP